MIKFFVPGKAASAGSKSAYKVGDKIVVAPASKFTKPWMDSVKWFAMKTVGKMCLLEGPIYLCITFIMSRPQGHYGTGRNAGKLKESVPIYPTVQPDLHKMVRAVEDALTGTVWKDDKQVVKSSIEKVYGDKPGALIEVDELLGAKEKWWGSCDIPFRSKGCHPNCPHQELCQTLEETNAQFINDEAKDGTTDKAK